MVGASDGFDVGMEEGLEVGMAVGNAVGVESTTDTKVGDELINLGADKLLAKVFK